MIYCMSDLSQTNSMRVRPLTSVLSGLDNLKTDLSWTILSRLDRKFKNFTSILDVENNQTVSSGLDDLQNFDLVLEHWEQLNGVEWARWSLQNFDLDLEQQRRWAWFHPFDLSGLSHYFIWTSTIRSGVVVVAGWLEVITSRLESNPIISTI